MFLGVFWFGDQVVVVVVVCVCGGGGGGGGPRQKMGEEYEKRRVKRGDFGVMIGYYLGFYM
jgi:hypothetical protein